MARVRAEGKATGKDVKAHFLNKVKTGTQMATITFAMSPLVDGAH